MKRADSLKYFSAAVTNEYKLINLFYNTEGMKKTDLCKFKEAAEFFTKAIELMPKDSAVLL